MFMISGAEYERARGGKQFPTLWISLTFLSQGRKTMWCKISKGRIFFENFYIIYLYPALWKWNGCSFGECIWLLWFLMFAMRQADGFLIPIFISSVSCSILHLTRRLSHPNPFQSTYLIRLRRRYSFQSRDYCWLIVVDVYHWMFDVSNISWQN